MFFAGVLIPTRKMVCKHLFCRKMVRGYQVHDYGETYLESWTMTRNRKWESIMLGSLTNHFSRVMETLGIFFGWGLNSSLDIWFATKKLLAKRLRQSP